MEIKNNIIVYGLLVVEAALLFAIFFSIPQITEASFGQNVTVSTNLTVGNVFPEVLNVSIHEDAATFELTANDTANISCVGIVRDYNGDSDIIEVNSTFYATATDTHFSADDNNTHYTNGTCTLNTSFFSYNGFTDDAYSALANCTTQVQFYANPGIWECNLTVTDTFGWNDYWQDVINISDLLAIGLPSAIQYGTVNATYVSDQQTANITNLGNTVINLSLSGYADSEYDGNSMGCTIGDPGNITIGYEAYNLTTSNTAALTLSQFDPIYTNLTSNATIEEYGLASRQNDSDFNFESEARNQTYWRIYVPTGVAGTCNGTILFGATQGVGV